MPPPRSSWLWQIWHGALRKRQGKSRNKLTWSFNRAQCEVPEQKQSWTKCSRQGSLEHKLADFDYRQLRKPQTSPALPFPPLTEIEQQCPGGAQVGLSVSSAPTRQVERKCHGDTSPNLPFQTMDTAQSRFCRLQLQCC